MQLRGRQPYYINTELDCMITWNFLYFCTKFNIKEITTNATKDTKPLFFCIWLSMSRKRLNVFILDLSLFIICEETILQSNWVRGGTVG